MANTVGIAVSIGAAVAAAAGLIYLITDKQQKETGYSNPPYCQQKEIVASPRYSNPPYCQQKEIVASPRYSNPPYCQQERVASPSYPTSFIECAPKETEYIFPKTKKELVRHDAKERQKALMILTPKTGRESQLHHYLLESKDNGNCNGVLQHFKYLLHYEYTKDGRSDRGQGDFVFCDEGGIILVVECKSLHPGTGNTAKRSRNLAKSKLLEQCCRYWRRMSATYSEQVVQCASVTQLQDGRIKWKTLVDYSAQPGNCIGNCDTHPENFE